MCNTLQPKNPFLYLKYNVHEITNESICYISHEILTYMVDFVAVGTSVSYRTDEWNQICIVREEAAGYLCIHHNVPESYLPWARIWWQGAWR